MARPTKQGIDYFPLDVQFDEKIELLIAEKGALAVSVLITVWQLIYKNEGYYIEYSDDLFLLIKRRIMIDEKLIKEILDAAIKRNVFNQTMKNKYSILTSKALQKRYSIASRLKKRINIISEYMLIDIPDVDNIIVSRVSNVGNSVSNGVNDVGNATNVNVNVNVKEENISVKKRPQKIPFEVFWNSYDKKVGKKSKINKKWDMLKLEIQQKILEHIVLYKEATPDKQFRKHPETYLNNESWEDEIIKKTEPPKNNFGNNYRSTSNPYEIPGEFEAFVERQKEKNRLAKEKWEKEQKEK